ncbi:MAG: CBS domain-containing protein [Thioalkalivibrio sp.]|jgi:signal-transduction protein with cAMP-binding, CBS, and nucleotidyltransferase domain|nr:CBS domain-containing protein [Thioalkalivibrio sp.]
MSERQPPVRVRDVMKTEVPIVDGMLTVREALERLRDIQTKSLLIEKRHEDDEYGIVLLSDIAKQVLARDRSPDRVNVYEVMSKPVVSVDPRMDIRYCARLFESFGLARAPVIENRKVVGVVSYTDMVLKGIDRDV